MLGSDMQDCSSQSILLIDSDASPGEYRCSVDEQLTHSNEGLLVNLWQL